MHPLRKNKTFGEIYDETMKREEKIRAHFPEENSTFIRVWECEVNQQLQSNKEMREFFKTVEDTTPFMPRDTLFGG